MMETREMFSCGRLNVMYLYKDEVRNSLKTHHVSTRNTSRRMLHREIGLISVYYNTHT